MPGFMTVDVTGIQKRTVADVVRQMNAGQTENSRPILHLLA